MQSETKGAIVLLARPSPWTGSHFCWASCLIRPSACGSPCPSAMCIAVEVPLRKGPKITEKSAKRKKKRNNCSKASSYLLSERAAYPTLGLGKARRSKVRIFFFVTVSRRLPLVAVAASERLLWAEAGLLAVLFVSGEGGATPVCPRGGGSARSREASFLFHRQKVNQEHHG